MLLRAEGAGTATNDEVLVERISTLEAECKRKSSEAEAVEAAFNDLRTRYEELKVINEKLKTVCFPAPNHATCTYCVCACVCAWFVVF